MRGLWRVLEAFFFWLLSIAALLLAAWLGVAALVTAAWARWVQLAGLLSQTAARETLAGTAAWLALVVLLAMLARIQLHKWRHTHLVVTTGDGDVHIATATINNFVRDAVRGSTDVVSARIETTHDRRKMNITVRVCLTGDTPVALRATLLQASLRQRVRETFGMDIVGTIRVMITGIRRAHVATPQLLDWRAGAAAAQHPVPAHHG
ncbi:MAG: alkaline shock response membrane anchor protein AmaP [bacterium]|nr:alkaline shock response membrane anchor protein AmaP [bacterium]